MPNAYEITHVEVSIINSGNWSGLEQVNYPVGSHGFLSLSDKAKVMIAGGELIRLGGDPEIIKDCNYGFTIDKSVSILEITNIVKAY